jgi:hypothetical protein
MLDGLFFDSPVQPLPQKHFAFSETKIRTVPSSQEGGSRSSRTLRRDAVDAAVSRDERTDADGEGVWSWCPDAGVAKVTMAKEPGHRGGHEINR